MSEPTPAPEHFPNYEPLPPMSVAHPKVQSALHRAIKSHLKIKVKGPKGLTRTSNIKIKHKKVRFY